MYNNNTVKKSTEYFVYGVIALQTVFAVWWLIKSGTVFVAEKMSNDYLSAAETMQCDDYMGIAYALVLRGVIKTVGTGGLFAVLIRVLQLGACFGAAFTLPVTFKTRFLIGLYIVTCPIVLQTLCEVLPYAFEFAIILASTGIAIKLLNTFSMKRALTLALSLAILGFLNPDAPWGFVAVMIPVALVLTLKKKIGSALGITIAALTAFLLCFFVNRAILEPYVYNRAEKSIEVLNFQRFVWPYVSDIPFDYYDFDTEDKLQLLQSVSEKPEGVIEELGYALEINSGREAAKNFYAYWAHIIPTYGKKRIFIPIIKDLIFYAFPSAGAISVYLAGTEDTLTAWNITNFIRTGEPARLFFSFFLLSSLIMCIAQLLLLMKRRGTFVSKRTKCFVIWIILAISAYETFFAIRGFDYRKCLFAAVALQILFIADVFENYKEC